MIYIIRHGQTENNKAKLLQGRSDIPLNKDGIRQAEAAAKWFCDQQIRIDSVYSSPLIRAVETAKIIAPEAPLFIEDRLIEMDYGPYEGMDLTNPAPEVRVFFSDFVHNPVPQGMEPLSSVTAGRRSEYYALHSCARDERRTGVSDSGFSRKLLVKVYRELCGLCNPHKRQQIWDAIYLY